MLRTLLIGLLLAYANLGMAKIEIGGIGYWKFKNPERPHKAVIFGGSISAFLSGNYGLFLQAVCPKLEVRNKAKGFLGAHHIRTRFDRQILKNPNFRKPSSRPESFWLFYLGGLNSVTTPHRTSFEIMKTFEAAHGIGMKVLALGLLPWGDDKDHRWAGARGLKLYYSAQHISDFILGSLQPKEALGRYLKVEQVEWLPQQRPDIAIRMIDSDLRHRAAKPRPMLLQPQQVARDSWVRRRLSGLSPEQRQKTLNQFVQTANGLPQWYMRPDLRYGDHFHPNREGHRIIAMKICPELPVSFGCRCQDLKRLVWKHRRFQLLP